MTKRRVEAVIDSCAKCPYHSIVPGTSMVVTTYPPIVKNQYSCDKLRGSDGFCRTHFGDDIPEWCPLEKVEDDTIIVYKTSEILT